MANMPNAPLVYTLGVVRFPTILEIHRYVPAFHESIREAFPHFDDVTMPMINATIGPDGFQIREVTTRLFQFASADRSWAIILSDTMLGVHTVSYKDHEDFIEKLISSFNTLKAVPGIKLNLVEALGLRYVDLIVPKEGLTLADYIQPWALPTTPPTLVDTPVEPVEGVYVASFRTEAGDLRFQALRNPPTTLPPELDGPLINANGWLRDRPNVEFALVDTDVGRHFTPPVDADQEFLVVRLRALHKVVRAVFDGLGTDQGSCPLPWCSSDMVVVLSGNAGR
jgi:uncharacterized protein (TIGR04255 family)